MKTCEKFTGYEALAEAIVIQAGIDYLDTKMKLETVTDEEKIKKLNEQMTEITGFFRSKWYRELTEANGEWMLKKLDEGYEKLKASGNLERIRQLQRV